MNNQGQESAVDSINTHYTDFYVKRNPRVVYPTEFVVRTFLANYPGLHFQEKPSPGSKVLDIGFGDCRNTVFLCQQGFDTYGIEITDTIVDLGNQRLKDLGCNAELKVGRNAQIPYSDQFFDCLLACHSCYYCDPGDTFANNVREFSRVLKPGGWFIGSVPDVNSYIFTGGKQDSSGCIEITNDPYENRNGYKLRAFASNEEIQDEFSELFDTFSFGSAENNYYGIDERVRWVVCRKKTA
jgi:ubiquinone/menaquinone biosynthesis C-methylase UbiE